jgi:hypothetical protein
MITKKKAEPIKIELSCDEKMKQTGGGESRVWNERLQVNVLSAIPMRGEDPGAAGTAIFSGMIDINPTDPIEGMLVAQLVVAHEASLTMYRRAWSQPDEYFDARCRYLFLADKAQRTVVLLTERLDHHRGRGRQEINVRHQHVTVNADQAIVGNVAHHQGGGSLSQSKDQPHALAYAPGVTLPSEDQTRELVPGAGDEERSVPDARRNVTRRTEGE